MRRHREGLFSHRVRRAVAELLPLHHPPEVLRPARAARQALRRRRRRHAGDDQARYPRPYACTKQIEAYIAKTYHFQITSSELLFLTVHISRLVKNL
ncbi:PRD domain-containing protein [Lacticaseibacillus camelliae]|uniref:PRD domain-containing protein n=1 Tax=Lacticaseibacillus camelliae TaxID=381742 RepID=UPI0034E283D5